MSQIIYASNKGKPTEIILDDEDIEFIGNRSLSIGSHGYAQIWDPQSKRLFLLHRYLMGLKEKTGYKFLVDHINRNVLDNRKSNLRIVSPAESNLNRTVISKEYPKNIYKFRSKYRVSIQRKTEVYRLGTYPTLKEAVQVRDKWILENDKGF